MNIRPVDTQINLNRTAEINRTTNNDGSRAENQNAQFTNSFQKANRDAEVEVNNSNKAENPFLKKDKEQEAKKRNRNRNNNKKHNEKESEKSLLDIKI